MTRPTPRLALMLGLALIVALAVGLLTPTGASAHLAETSVARAVRPKVNECHDLTAKRAGGLSDTSAPVSCSKRHTTRVIAVFDLPAGLAFSDPAAAIAAQQRCYPAVRAVTGARSYNRLALSAFSFAFFYPTKAQRQQGFRFVRCDLTLPNGTGLTPLPLNSDLLLRRGIPERYRRCNNDATAFFPCTRAHRNRAVASFTLPGEAYPGDQAQRETGAQQCTQLVGRTFEFFYFPTRPEWRSGYHAFTCLRRDQ